jgi:hypothetical protein
MARSAEKRSRPRASEVVSDDDVFEGDNVTGAADKVSPEILDALAFGYLWALKNAESFDVEQPTFADAKPKSMPMREPGFEDFEVFPDEFAAEEEALAREKARAPDIIGDVISCIFVAFDQRGIPITTTTKPSSKMSLDLWIAVGRGILACAARKYPEFGPVARPSRLRAFYNQSLLTLAQAIRSSIIKRQ